MTDRTHSASWPIPLGKQVPQKPMISLLTTENGQSVKMYYPQSSGRNGPADIVPHVINFIDAIDSQPFQQTTTATALYQQTLRDTALTSFKASLAAITANAAAYTFDDLARLYLSKFCNANTRQRQISALHGATKNMLERRSVQTVQWRCQHRPALRCHHARRHARAH